MPRRSVWGDSGLGVSCENFARFLELCAQLQRGLLYLWPQIRRHTDIVAFEGSVETYPRAGSKDPFEKPHSEKMLIHTNTQHLGTRGPSLMLI